MSTGLNLASSLSGLAFIPNLCMQRCVKLNRPVDTRSAGECFHYAPYSKVTDMNRLGSRPFVHDSMTGPQCLPPQGGNHPENFRHTDYYVSSLNWCWNYLPFLLGKKTFDQNFSSCMRVANHFPIASTKTLFEGGGVKVALHSADQGPRSPRYPTSKLGGANSDGLRVIFTARG